MPSRTDKATFPTGIRTIGITGALFALNAFVCRELFFTEYTEHLASIEGAYIGISRYLLNHPLDWGWFPLWYGGIPFQNSYPPLLHFLVAAAAWVFNISPALSHHAVTAALYSAGPCGVFLLAYTLSGNHFLSLVSAVVYSLISPSVIVSSSVASWAVHFWNPARLQALLIFGDGPHVASVAFIPFAVLGLHLALEKATPVRVFAAALGLITVVLTNWLGAFGLALAVLSYLIARSSEPQWIRRIATAVAIGALAYVIASPWIPPSTIQAIQYNAQYTIGSYPLTTGHIAYAGLLVAAAWALRYLFEKLGAPIVFRFAAFFSLFTGALVLGYELAGVSLMPQPHRYHHELEMALCIAGVFLLGWPFRAIGAKPKLALAAVVGLLAIVQVFVYRNVAVNLIRPINMQETVEYQLSRWLQDNFPDRRVFLSGSTQFWLNAFADTPQLGGGFGQGVINDRVPIVHYGVPWTIGDGENTAMWLRLYGVKAVAVSGPEGRDVYKEVWRDAKKFDGVLPELWRQGGDVIYGVPQRSESLAHVILPRHEVARPPIHNLDLEPVAALSAALEDDALPLAAWSWQGPDRARISATLSPEQLLFVQVSYHRGWKAFVDGEPRVIRHDSLGLMIVEPNCSGPCEVRLEYDGGPEMLAARILSGSALLGGFVWFLAAGKRRRRGTLPEGVMTNLFEQMGRDWNERASQDASFYVAFEKRNQGEEFWSGGADVIDFVLDSYSKWSREAGNPLTQQAAAPDGNVRALEIGCGPGRLMRRLAPVVGEVYGLDISSEMIARGQAMAAHSNVRFHQLTSSRFEGLSDATFDFAYSFAVFQHIPDKQIITAYVLEAFRVLKPGGVFAAQFCMSEQAYGEAETWGGAVYSRSEVRELAKQAGFRLVSLDGQSERYTWAILVKPAGTPDPGAEPSVKLHNVWAAVGAEEPLTAWGPGATAAVALSGLDKDACDIAGIELECSDRLADVTYFGPTVYPGILQINFLVPEGLAAQEGHELKISSCWPPLWSAETTFALAPDPPESMELLWITDGDEVTNYGRITSRVAKVQVRGIRDPQRLRLQFPGGEPLDPEAIASVNRRLGWYEINFRLPSMEPGEIEVMIRHTGLGASQSTTVTLG